MINDNTYNIGMNNQEFYADNWMNQPQFNEQFDNSQANLNQMNYYDENGHFDNQNFEFSDFNQSPFQPNFGQGSLVVRHFFVPKWSSQKKGSNLFNKRIHNRRNSLNSFDPFNSILELILKKFVAPCGQLPQRSNEETNNSMGPANRRGSYPPCMHSFPGIKHRNHPDCIRNA